MKVARLELDLTLALENATESPKLVDLQALWQQIEPTLQQLSVQEQLHLGGRVIEQLATIYQAKAQTWLDEWESVYDPQDPVLAGDWLQGFVRQTQHLDLSELTEPAHKRPSKVDGQDEGETLAGEVPKANLLQMLDQVEEASKKNSALAVAHEERIEEWVAAIHHWFDHHPDPLPLPELRQQLGWPLVQLWLSLLLGGFRLETMGPHFYNSRVLVSR